jgi:hypothetical protein
MADRQSEQSILEKVFDPIFQVLKVAIYGSDGTNLQRLQTDTSGRLVVSEDSTMLLRDIRKLLRASSYGDVAKRQIVKIGALGGISGGAEVTTTLPISGAVTLANLPAVGGFDARFQLYDMARVKYATGMRANLSFT